MVKLEIIKFFCQLAQIFFCRYPFQISGSALKEKAGSGSVFKPMRICMPNNFFLRSQFVSQFLYVNCPVWFGAGPVWRRARATTTLCKSHHLLVFLNNGTPKYFYVHEFLYSVFYILYSVFCILYYVRFVVILKSTAICKVNKIGLRDIKQVMVLY